MENPYVMCDEYGEVINHQQTFEELARILKKKGAVVFGWSDREGTHFDVVLTLQPTQFGLLQGGQRGSTDLFVGVRGMGCFGFDRYETKSHWHYIEGKIGHMGPVTGQAFGELINGVRKYL